MSKPIQRDQAPRAADIAPPHAEGRASKRWLVLIMVLALLLRCLDIKDPWSGVPGDFRSTFGGAATGGPARNLVQYGLWETKGLPYSLRFEDRDGQLQYSYYSHHPASFALITAASMKVFGNWEWAARLPWILISCLAVFSVWRLGNYLFGARCGLWAALLAAVLPTGAHYGSMLWTEGAVAWIGAEVVLASVRWLRERDGGIPWAAASWAFVGGLFEWSLGFVLVGVGLFVLAHAMRGSRWRRLWSSLAIPTGFGLAVLLHALHVTMVVPRDALLDDSEQTLAWVRSLPVDLGSFLSIQWNYLWRDLTGAGLLGSIAAGLWLLLRALGGRGVQGSAALFALLLAAPLYVGLFPSRSVNHHFFWAISTPGYALVMARALLELSNSKKFGSRLGWLLALGIAAMSYSARPSKGFDFSKPESYWGLPLLLAIYAAPALLVFALVAKRWARPLSARLLASGSAVALAVLTANCVWGNVRLWILRRSDRVQQVVEASWIEPHLKNERCLIVTLGAASLPLQFYAAGPVLYGVPKRADFEWIQAEVLDHLALDYRVLFLFEHDEFKRLKALGRATPEKLAEMAELREHLLQSAGTSSMHGNIEVFELPRN